MYKITKEQVQSLLNVLVEMPAKMSFNAIVLLNSLEKIEDEKKASE